MRYDIEKDLLDVNKTQLTESSHLNTTNVTNSATAIATSQIAHKVTIEQQQMKATGIRRNRAYFITLYCSWTTKIISADYYDKTHQMANCSK